MKRRVFLVSIPPWRLVKLLCRLRGHKWPATPEQGSGLFYEYVGPDTERMRHARNGWRTTNFSWCCVRCGRSLLSCSLRNGETGWYSIYLNGRLVGQPREAR